MVFNFTPSRKRGLNYPIRLQRRVLDPAPNPRSIPFPNITPFIHANFLAVPHHATPKLGDGIAEISLFLLRRDGRAKGKKTA